MGMLFFNVLWTNQSGVRFSNNDEWMMHLYSTLLCIVVHPKRFTIIGGGGLSSITTSDVTHC